MSTRLVILGGGVIGLSIAWEALRRGFDVTVIDRSDLPGRASPAGAGILVPGHPENSAHPLDRMTGLSLELHRKWSKELLAETGIENGLIPCGGVYLANTAGEVASLSAQMAEWQSEEIESSSLTHPDLEKLLGQEFRPKVEVLSAWHVPSEMQICNTTHLEALTAAIVKWKGQIVRLNETTAANVKFQLSESSGEFEAVVHGDVVFPCDHFCLAAGAWSGQVAKSAGVHLPTTPVRGQMLLFKLPRREFVPVTSIGTRYVVPRADGHVLAGSTMEEVGFDASTTADGLNGLKSFAASLFPILNESSLVQSWAGLRPASFDGMPIIGRLSAHSNAVVCTGHMRFGLQWSTASAVMVCDILMDKPVDPDLLHILSPLRIANRPA